MQINLGRILVKAERFSEAIAAFDQLDFMQSLDGKPAALLAYGQALAGAGDAATAQSTFATALEAAPEAKVRNSLNPIVQANASLMKPYLRCSALILIRSVYALSPLVRILSYG